MGSSITMPCLFLVIQITTRYKDISGVGQTLTLKVNPLQPPSNPDPLSIAASIVGLVGLVTAASQWLTQFLSNTRSAPSRIYPVCKLLSNLAALLDGSPIPRLPSRPLPLQELSKLLHNIILNFTELKVLVNISNVQSADRVIRKRLK